MGKLFGHVIRLTVALLAVGSALLSPVPVLADGIIIIDPPMPVPPPDWSRWLTIRYHHVTVRIEDQVAVTEVDQVFRNDARMAAEGTYIFPLPKGAVVEDFLMWVDDEPLESRILPAAEAREIYEGYVRRNQDPALLEYVGRDAVQARIFPIPPGEERRIRLRYTQVLPVEDGLLHYRYPLNTERFSAQPLEEVKVNIEVVLSTDLAALYSPTHQDKAVITRDGAHRATITYEARDLLPDQDFEIYVGLGDGALGAAVLSYKPSAEDGFFLLLLSPPIRDAQSEVVPRDLVIVLDTSGSMDGEKLEQAQAGLTYILEHLNAGDRFNVVAFSSQVRSYAPTLVPATEAQAALDWIQSLEAIGGTNIQLALSGALSQVGDTRHTTLIFITDGLPTEGIVDEGALLQLLHEEATADIRIFPLGVGYDVNVLLLDQMAENHRGRPTYIAPDERIDQRISTFFERMQSPLLTDIRLDFRGNGSGTLEVYDLYPTPLPDLYAGTQLIVTGRYAGGGGAQVLEMSGRVDDRQVTYEYEIELEDHDGAAFIPRLWAARKIGHLLTLIRLQGEETEWVDAVVALSLKYGIITPYTSFLIEEPEEALSLEGRESAGETLKQELAAAPAMVSGEEAVEDAQLRLDLGGAEAPAEGRSYAVPGAGDTSPGSGTSGTDERSIRYVEAKTFICTETQCTDTTFVTDVMVVRDVPLGSGLYNDLMTQDPHWGAYFALAPETIVVKDDTTAYRLTLNTAETTDPTGQLATPGPDSTVTPASTPADATPSPRADAVSPQGGIRGCATAYLMLIPVAVVTLKKLWYTKFTMPSSGQGEAKPD